MHDRMIERTFGGGTHRTLSLLEADPMAASARFLALKRETERLMDECGRLTDEALAANAVGNVDRARELMDQGNVMLRQAAKLRREMAA